MTRRVIDDFRAAETPPPPGDNQPPGPTPYEQSQAEIDGLFEEAGHWLDGEGVKTQEQADAVGKLLDLLRKAGKTAEARRKAENEPFDRGKAEVQARYKPLTTKVDLAAEQAKKALNPFLIAQAAEQAKVAEAARIAADAARLAAETALRASNASDEANLADRVEAEALVKAAQSAEKAAAKAEKAKPQAQTGGRAAGLVTVSELVVEDGLVLAKHLWLNYREFVDAAHKDVATYQWRLRGIIPPGCKVETRKEVR